MKHALLFILLAGSAVFADEFSDLLKTAQATAAARDARLAAPAPTPNYQAQQLQELQKLNAAVKALQPVVLTQDPNPVTTVVVVPVK